MKKEISVSIISMKDNKGGGAFTASYRLLLALLKYGCSVDMLVQFKHSENPNVVCPINLKDKLSYLARIFLTRIIFKLLGNKNNSQQTLALFNSGWADKINSYPTDIINLHWVAGEMISVREIGNISKPVVWTLHDMWPFSGIDHYSFSGINNAFSFDEDLFDVINENNNNIFFDLDINVLKRKTKHWTKPIHIVTPSNWLASCVKNSSIMNNWPVTVIPNIIETTIFKPLSKTHCRKIFGFDEKKKIILFGAFAGIVNKSKGFSILLKSLDEISEKLPSNSEVVIFGQEEPSNFKYGKFNKIKWLGHIDDEQKMCTLYNTADIVVVPSKIEAFGLVAAEAHACGVPVVAFRHSGIQEVVTHQKTGYLATSFEFSDFASGILWTLENSKWLSPLARKKACDEWSPEVIIPKYMKLYKSVIEDYNKYGWAVNEPSIGVAKSL